MSHFVIMAGGTGGHVFPALAVARSLQEQGHSVSWLGTQKGIEERLVPKANIPLNFIDIAGVRGKGMIGLVQAPFKIVHAVCQSIKILRQEKPQAVLGMGGFVAGPGGLAAKLLGIPLVIHEQNAVAGTTNRILARMADRVLQAFPGSFAKTVAAQTIGNPVRGYLKPQNKPVSDVLHVLILGGSLGAKAINDVMPLALNPLEQVAVWHQTGKNYVESVKSAYRDNMDVSVEEFIDHMDKAYAWADVIVCRAGAMTVSEVAAVALPALFIPFPYAIDDHQTANANILVAQQAAFLLPQQKMTVSILQTYIKQWQDNREQRQMMANNAAKCAVYDAAEQVAKNCLEVSRG